jgi:PadR family transcriptional regulator PadR
MSQAGVSSFFPPFCLVSGCPGYRDLCRLSAMASSLRITLPLVRILGALYDSPTPRYGRELVDLTHFPSGTIYPLLHRLVDAGVVDRNTEDGDPFDLGRPLRIYYTLTSRGRDFVDLDLRPKGHL